MKKKIVILSVLCLMLALTGYLNYFSEKSESDYVSNENEYIPVGEAVPVSSDSTSKTETDYFKKSRIDKENDRAEAIDLLNSIIDNPNVDNEARVNAENRLAVIADNIVMESTAESLIMAKGYKDAVVFIDDSSVNAVIYAENLSADDTAKIRDIIYEQTKNNNIKIVAVN